MALPDFNLAASDPANPNARLLSAEQQRAMLAEAIMQQKQGSDTSPIQSGWQGAARLAQGLMGGLERGRLDSDAAKGNAAWQKAMGNILGGGAAAPASTPLGAAIMGGDGASPTSAPASAPAPADGGDLTEAYIRSAAAQRGIDPEIAVKVAKSEGLNAYTGDQGSSFGPFQLHYGGVAPGGNRVAGMGDDFTKATGLDARDPKTVNAQIDFALDQAKKGGWTPFHGAANSGIAPMQGIGQGGNVQLAGPVPTPDSAAAPQAAAQSPTATAPAPAAPQIDRQALMAIISNPYAPAAAQQVAASILQNSFKQETAAPVSVGKGGALVDPRTGRVIYQGTGGEAEADTKNHVVANALVDPHGKVLYKADPAESSLDQTTTDFLAERVVKGDPSALIGLGRGRQGAENIAAVQKRAAEMSNNQGIGVQGVLDNQAELGGKKAGARTLGQMNARLDTYANTAASSMDFALQKSAEVPRGQWLPLTQVIQMGQKAINDPKLAAFNAANQTLVNEYSKAVNPSGVPTDSAKQHAYDMLNTAQSPEAYAAVVNTLKREVQIAHAAVRDTIKAQRHGAEGEGQYGAPPAESSAPGPSIRTYNPGTGKLE